MKRDSTRLTKEQLLYLRDGKQLQREQTGSRRAKQENRTTEEATEKTKEHDLCRTPIL